MWYVLQKSLWNIICKIQHRQKPNQTKPKLMYLHNILFTVQSVLEVLALCLCFQLLNFTSTQLSSIPKSCWGSVILWLCARLAKRLLIQLAISKLCNLKSSFLYYFKTHLIVSCKNYMLKKSHRLINLCIISLIVTSREWTLQHMALDSSLSFWLNCPLNKRWYFVLKLPVDLFITSTRVKHIINNVVWQRNSRA